MGRTVSEPIAVGDAPYCTPDADLARVALLALPLLLLLLVSGTAVPFAATWWWRRSSPSDSSSVAVATLSASSPPYAELAVVSVSSKWKTSLPASEPASSTGLAVEG